MISCQIPSAGPYARIRDLAVLADQLGYQSLSCAHIAGRDSFSTLAALGQHTDQAVLGTAVAPIYHRSPASMAQSAATVDDVTGGRFRLGLGVGHRVTMLGWHGQHIGSPVGELREYVGIVRALLAGESAPQGQRWQTTFAFTGFAARPDIPIYLAALSPTMLRLAGEIADGVLLWACPASYVQDVAIPEIGAGRAARGLDLTGFDIVPAVPSAVDVNRAAALDGVRNELHRYFGLPFYRAMFLVAGFADELTAFDAAHPDREAQKLAISERFIDALCAIGDAAEVAAGVQRYRDAGATNPMITNIIGTDFAATLEAAAHTVDR